MRKRLRDNALFIPLHIFGNQWLTPLGDSRVEFALEISAQRGVAPLASLFSLGCRVHAVVLEAHPRAGALRAK